MFDFHEEDGFETNIEAFLLHVDMIDPEKGAILREMFPKLVFSEDERVRTATRISFNSEVRQKLELLETFITLDAE